MYKSGSNSCQLADSLLTCVGVVQVSSCIHMYLQSVGFLLLVLEGVDSSNCSPLCVQLHTSTLVAHFSEELKMCWLFPSM